MLHCWAADVWAWSYRWFIFFAFQSSDRACGGNIVRMNWRYRLVELHWSMVMLFPFFLQFAIESLWWFNPPPIPITSNWFHILWKNDCCVSSVPFWLFHPILMHFLVLFFSFCTVPISLSIDQFILYADNITWQQKLEYPPKLRNGDEITIFVIYIYIYL